MPTAVGLTALFSLCVPRSIIHPFFIKNFLFQKLPMTINLTGGIQDIAGILPLLGTEQ
jgi:hypothetical protein